MSLNINTEDNNTSVVSDVFYTVRPDFITSRSFVDGEVEQALDANGDGKISHDELISYFIRKSGNRSIDRNTDREWAEEQIQKCIELKYFAID